MAGAVVHRYPVVPIVFGRTEERAEMQDHAPKTDLRIQVIYGLICLVGAAVYAGYPMALEYFGAASPKFLEDFVRELALATSTAAGIGVLFENFSSRRLVHDASEQIAARVMAQHLPKEFEDQIRQIVHGTSVVMEDWRTQYSLQVEGKGVRVTIDTEYRARNYGLVSEKYQPSNSDEQMYQPCFTLLEVVHKNKQIPHQIRHETDPATGVVTVQGPKVRLARHNSEGDYCVVHWRYECTMPLDYTHIQAFGRPAVTPRLSASVPEGLSFTATLSDASEYTPTTWKYDRAYLAGQHLRVWWKPNA